jgi:hypothetical protein
LYEDDVFNPRNPIYPTGDEQFVTYYFLDTIKVSVNTSFFVGWRQLDPERLNLGLDRNLDFSSKIKFSVNGGATWLTSPFSGSAMIRPVFSTKLDDLVGINEEAFEIKIFPNPTSDIFQIILPQEDNNLEKILFDQTGRILLKTNENQIDLSNFSAGYFFLQIPQLSQKSWKIVKN